MEYFVTKLKLDSTVSDATNKKIKTFITKTGYLALENSNLYSWPDQFKSVKLTVYIIFQIILAMCYCYHQNNWDIPKYLTISVNHVINVYIKKNSQIHLQSCDV